MIALRLLCLAALVLVTPLRAQANYTLLLDQSVPGGVPETGNDELFNLAIPNPPLPDMPLIVVFHGQFSSNHHQVVTASQNANGWDLLTDATNAGFMVLMPRAGHPNDYPAQPSYGIFTYGRQIMHYHVAAAIKTVLQSYSVDQDRIYGYGLSMGGGDVLSYAARHLDPTGPMLAAVVTHSGTVSTPYTYHHGATNWQRLLEGLYQATDYATDELKFQRATAVDYDLSGLRVDTSMGWNLTHVPVANFYDSNGVGNDDTPETIAQNLLLDDLMSDPLKVGHPSYSTANTTGDGHGYIFLDTASILGAFTASLEIPKKGKTLVAEPFDPLATDERVFHFRVTRRTGPMMASFVWDTHYVPPGQIQRYPPLLDLHELDHIDTIRCITRKLGYSPLTELEIDAEIADAQPVTIELSGYGAGVSQVFGNGVLLQQGTDWGLTGSILWIVISADTLIRIVP